MSMGMPMVPPATNRSTIPPPNIRRASTLRPNMFSSYSNTDTTAATATTTTTTTNKYERSVSPSVVPPAPPLRRRGLYHGGLSSPPIVSEQDSSITLAPTPPPPHQQHQPHLSESGRLSHEGMGVASNRRSFQTPPRANTHHAGYSFRDTSITSPMVQVPATSFNNLNGTDDSRIMQLQTLQQQLRSQHQAHNPNRHYHYHQHQQHRRKQTIREYDGDLTSERRRDVMVSEQRRLASTLRVSKVGSVPRNLRLPMQSHSTAVSPVGGPTCSQQQLMSMDSALFR